MPKIGVTQEEVIKAAQAIVKKGSAPTATNIREYLGSGSSTTIHKYLKRWKRQCFQKVNNDPSIQGSEALFREVQLVRQSLAKQTSKNEELAGQLIQAERNITKLQGINQQLINEFNLLKEQQQQITATCDKYKTAYESVMADREGVISSILEDKNNLIGSLRQELKEINKASIEQVKNIGRKGDDALMEEKVKTIHLQDELNQQRQTIEELRAQLLKNQETIIPLKKEVERQRKFIHEVVSFEQLQQYEQQKQQAEFEGNK